MRKRVLISAAVLLVSLLSVAHGQSAPDEESDFPLAIVEHQLSSFRDGLLAQDPRKALAGFSHMPDRDRLAHRLTLLFDRYQSVRVFYTIGQTSTENAGQRGIASAEFTMEATPWDQLQPPVRRTTELRLEFTLVNGQWEVVGLQPLAYFEGF